MLSIDTRIPAHRLLPGKSPIPGGNYHLSSVGYAEREYVLEGVARSFTIAGERRPDGVWTVSPAEDAPYTSRIVVRAPLDPARFSGIVFVEWNNVSGGIDVGPDWMFFHRYLISHGHAWAGVTAQKAGIDGGGIVEGLHLKVLDPERYRDLRHPGDAWAYDIFSQAARLLSNAATDGPLEGLSPTRLVAVGESQSAAFLVTYINAIDPVARIFDGFFVHGRPGAAASIDGVFMRSQTDVADTARAHLHGRERIRADARVPVMVVQSETDVILLGGAGPQQPDGDNLRLWEVAGAAHAETYLLVASLADDGHLGAERLAELLKPTTKLMAGETETPVNSGPQQHYIGQAALHHLVSWINGGWPPPPAARLEINDRGNGLVLGAHGNAIGGIRSPWVEVPTATLSGLGQTGDGFAALFGTTEAFDSATLAALYPGGRSDYVDRFTTALDSTIAAGFILPEDRAEILAVTAAANPCR